MPRPGATALYLPIAASYQPAILVGAGDIADCTTPWDEATADLIDHIPGTVVTMGDNAYETGTANEFKYCYEFKLGPLQSTHAPLARQSRLPSARRRRLL